MSTGVCVLSRTFEERKYFDTNFTVLRQAFFPRYLEKHILLKLDIN